MWISLCLCVLLLHYVAANSNIISKIHRNSFRYTHHRSFSWPSLLGKCKKQSSIAPAIRAKDPAIIHATSELALIGPDTSFTALRSSSSSRLSGVRRWLSQCIAPLKYLRSTSSILREWERDMDAMEIPVSESQILEKCSELHNMLLNRTMLLTNTCVTEFAVQRVLTNAIAAYQTALLHCVIDRQTEEGVDIINGSLLVLPVEELVKDFMSDLDNLVREKRRRILKISTTVDPSTDTSTTISSTTYSTSSSSSYTGISLCSRFAAYFRLNDRTYWRNIGKWLLSKAASAALALVQTEVRKRLAVAACDERLRLDPEFPRL